MDSCRNGGGHCKVLVGSGVATMGGHCGWVSWVVVVVVEEEGGCCLLTCLLMPKSSIGMLDSGGGHGTQNISRPFYYLSMVTWYSC